jgi:hypothetical protein
MAKWAAVEEINDEDAKYKVKMLLSQELKLMHMKFELLLREKYNDEFEIKYGFKQEKKVLA